MTSYSLLDFPVGAATPVPNCDLRADDWDLLFNALRSRLRLISGPQHELDSDDAAAPSLLLRIRVALVECTDDLEHLHVMLAAERGREARMAREDYGPHAIAGPGRAPALRTPMRDHAQRRLNTV